MAAGCAVCPEIDSSCAASSAREMRRDRYHINPWRSRTVRNSRLNNPYLLVRLSVSSVRPW